MMLGRRSREVLFFLASGAGAFGGIAPLASGTSILGLPVPCSLPVPYLSLIQSIELCRQRTDKKKQNKKRGPEDRQGRVVTLEREGN